MKFQYNCGAKGSGDPGSFHIRPMAHAEEEEMSKNEQKESDLRKKGIMLCSYDTSNNRRFQGIIEIFLIKCMIFFVTCFLL